MLENFLQLIRLRNQVGTFLLLLPSLWAIVLASHGSPSIKLLVIFSVGAFVMRSAGVVVNDLADQTFDRQVARTRNRPLASGVLTGYQALLFLFALLIFAAGLLWFLNPLAVWLSPIALILAVLYPFTKRVFHLPQFFLGLAFGWGVVMAWAATRNQLDLSVWLLYGATVFWAIAYDTIYALQDREDDRRVGIKSSALLFGSKVWIAVGLALGGMLIFLLMAGTQEGLGPIYYGVLAGTAGFFSHQVWRLRQDLLPPEAFSLFRQHIWAGSAILVGIWAGSFY